MKKPFMLLCIVLAVVCSYQCKNATDDSSTESVTRDPFRYTVTEDLTHFKNLPALQSFAFATADNGNYWLMFSGRTNGFHGFGGNQNFPFKKANKFLYAFNTQSQTLDSMPVSSLPLPLQEQYASTNMASRQVDSFLYACGGYGLKNAGKKDSAFVTFSTLSRIHIKKMINAIIKHDANALAASIAFDTNPIVQTTGGELYKLPDGKFYVVVGHRYSGEYNSKTIPSQQIYLDSVHVFVLKETADKIMIDTKSFKYISDNKPDSFTQFRRRDLVVQPYVLPGGNYGIGIYGGVFTVETNPFRHPIYITGGIVPEYTVDTSFKQLSNIYSAPALAMYDSKLNRMYTTIFGGLGDTVLVNGDNASFTKLILTIKRDYAKSNATSSIYNPTQLPHFTGSEGVFIRDSNIPVYKNNKLDIMDYSQFSFKDSLLLGYIYGGIRSDSTQWNSKSSNDTAHINITHASNKVYKVYLKKN